MISQNLEENLYYLDNQICGIFFTKLSDHRKIDRQVINNYKSIYFPSTQITDNRKFCAYEYIAIVQTKNKHIQTFVKNLSNSLQTELSIKTGLSPSSEELSGSRSSSRWCTLLDCSFQRSSSTTHMCYSFPSNPKSSFLIHKKSTNSVKRQFSRFW